MSIADFPYRLATIGGPFRDAIGKLRAQYTKRQVPEGAKFVCSARVDHAVLGLPGAEVKVEAATNRAFDVEMPYDEVKALEWETVPAKSLIQIGFREGAVFSGGMSVTNAGIKIGVVADDRDFPEDAGDEPEHRIQRSLSDSAADPGGLTYLRLLALRRGNGLTQVWQHEFMAKCDGGIKRAVSALRPLGVTAEDLEQGLRAKHGHHLTDGQ